MHKSSHNNKYNDIDKDHSKEYNRHEQKEKPKKTDKHHSRSTVHEQNNSSHNEKHKEKSRHKEKDIHELEKNKRDEPLTSQQILLLKEKQGRFISFFLKIFVYSFISEISAMKRINKIKVRGRGGVGSAIK